MQIPRLFAVTAAMALLVCGSTVGIAAAPVFPASIAVTDAWVRANAPGLDVAAAYLKIRNGSGRPVKLVRISTPAASMASMHITVIKRGMSSMLEVPVVEIAAGETVQFEPGGMHVMLMGLAKPLQTGSRIVLRLTLENGASTDLSVPVRSLAGT